MILSIKKKEEFICKIRGKLECSLSVVMADLQGVTANAMNQLRKELRDLGVYTAVVSNTLLRRAIRKSSFECLSSLLINQNIIAVSMQNPRDAARVFVNFSRNNENFKIKGAVFEGNLLDLNQVHLLSNLPSYKESILQLILHLKIIGIGNFINILKKISNHRITT